MRRRFLKSRDVPNNRIYYLTSDMQKIAVKLYPSIGEATSDYGFGSPMVSNEFDGEKFIITCLSNITQIGCYSFNSTNLINIRIPNSVISIESYAFESCTSLTSIKIPNSVISIGGGAFRGCYSLTSIQIPNSVTSIGNSAFEYCSSLTSVVWNAKKCSDFSSSAPFENCSNITSFTFGDEVEYIPAYLCHNLSKLSSIQIPNTVTSIGRSAFSDCKSLTGIEIPNSVTSIGRSAFSDCRNLTNVVIGNSVTSIREWAFSDCTSLTSIEIPNSVTSIGAYAFKYCKSLTSVYVKSTTPPTLDSYVFDGNASDRKIYIPRASLNAYKTASGWKNYASSIEPYDFDGGVVK